MGRIGHEVPVPQAIIRAVQRERVAREGDVWRMDFSRFNTYKEAPPAKDSGGWVWTRHGIWDSHIPECFAHVRFSTNPISTIVPSAQRK